MSVKARRSMSSAMKMTKVIGDDGGNGLAVDLVGLSLLLLLLLMLSSLTLLPPSAALAADLKNTMFDKASPTIA